MQLEVCEQHLVAKLLLQLMLSATMTCQILFFVFCGFYVYHKALSLKFLLALMSCFGYFYWLKTIGIPLQVLVIVCVKPSYESFHVM